MSKHTPGKWVVAHRGFEGKPTVVAHRAGRPCTIALLESGKREEDAANARLIAAAPELLDTLKRAAIDLTKKLEERGELADSDTIALIHAVIAKAEGQS